MSSSEGCLRFISAARGTLCAESADPGWKIVQPAGKYSLEDATDSKNSSRHLKSTEAWSLFFVFHSSLLLDQKGSWKVIKSFFFLSRPATPRNTIMLNNEEKRKWKSIMAINFRHFLVRDVRNGRRTSQQYQYWRRRRRRLELEAREEERQGQAVAG